MHWAKHMQQDLLVDLLIDRLALWQELPMDKGLQIEEHDQHNFGFWFRLSCFLWPRQYWRLPLTAQTLGFWVILKNPCLITCVESMKQVWFSLMRTWHTCEQCSFWPLFSSLRPIFEQTFCIFGDNLPNKRTCTCLNSELTIATHHLPYMVINDLSFTCWRPLPLLKLSFASSTPLFEPLVPLKKNNTHTCSLYGCYLQTFAEAFQVFEREF